MDLIVREIPYGDNDRQRGDLFLPAGDAAGPPVLLIHGGGWNALAKESIEPVARLSQGIGLPVFSINYRLLKHAPWPACGDDCLAAGRFLLDGGLAAHGLGRVESVLVVGASAGGHLAMMTGLRLPRDRVRGILSMAGPSRLHYADEPGESAIGQAGFLDAFFGQPTPPDHPRVRQASPVDCVGVSPPPLTCIHSVNDRLVPPWHSEDAVRAWTGAGSAASLLTYDGPGRQHGFWTSDDLATRELIPAVSRLLTESLSRHHTA